LSTLTEKENFKELIDLIFQNQSDVIIKLITFQKTTGFVVVFLDIL